MEITYTTGVPITVDQFVDVLRRSTLAERRPVGDRQCMAGMLEHGNLLVCAWAGDELVGVARSVTDFHYCCYLSDLAVDKARQNRGIGRRLQRLTCEQLGPHCKLILLAAPGAAGYYPHLGYAKHDGCWILSRARESASILFGEDHGS